MQQIAHEWSVLRITRMREDVAARRYCRNHRWPEAIRRFIGRCKPRNRRSQLQAKIERRGTIGHDQLNWDAGLVHKRFSDEVGADIRLQRAAVEDLLYAVGLHGGGEAEF